MSKINADEFHEDGTKLFNPTKAHGTIYADGHTEGQWVQDGVIYRADRLPLKHAGTTAPAVEVVQKKQHWRTALKQAKANQESHDAGTSHA